MPTYAWHLNISVFYLFFFFSCLVDGFGRREKRVEKDFGGVDEIQLFHPH